MSTAWSLTDTPVPDIPILETAEEVLSQKIKWSAYEGAGVLDKAQLKLLLAYDRQDVATQRALLAADGDAGGAAYARLFVHLLGALNKEAPLKYVLTLVDNALKDRPANIELFLALATAADDDDADGGGGGAAGEKRRRRLPYSALERVLQRDSTDFYTNSKACTILTQLVAAGGDAVPKSSVKFVTGYLQKQLAVPSVDEARLACLGLRQLLADDRYRTKLFKAGVLDTLVAVMRGMKKSIQLLYEASYCVWLMTFNAAIAAAVPDQLVPTVIDTLRQQEKDKVKRMCIAILANVVERGGDDNVNAQVMIDAGLDKLLMALRARKNGDEEMVANIEFLHDAMQRNIVTLSSFDMYCKEVLSGKLDWSPVHKSEMFWRDNIHKFEEKNYSLVKVLKGLLRADDPKVQAVACFDLGEFARIHPRGKEVLEEIGAKAMLVSLMAHKDAQVQKQALFSVQKLMVKKWEWLA